jgi:putative methionine-R-sulfoxide reductase with GAF domain
MNNEWLSSDSAEVEDGAFALSDEGEMALAELVDADARLAESTIEPDEQTVQRIVAGVRKRLRKLQKAEEGERALNLVEGARTAAIQASRNGTIECLTAEVGTLADEFLASQAWLFAEVEEEGERVLRAVVTHRTNQRGLRIVVADDSPGIVAQVGRTQRGYLAKNVRTDSHYMECSKWTISEVAVPIFDAEGKRLLGVLNFESSQNVFTEEDLSELQVAAQRLAVALICLKWNSASSSRHWPWSPAHGNWMTSITPQQVCVAAVRALQLGDSADSCSAIVWNADWEKNVLWVLGTTYYDSMYLAAQRFQMNSYTGKVACKCRWSVSISSPEEDAFVERNRAAAAGLKRMASVPLFRTTSIDQFPGRAWGVFHAYFFGDNVEEIFPDKRGFADFAFRIEELLSSYEVIRSECATAYVRWKMEASIQDWMQISAMDNDLESGMLYCRQLNVLKELLVDILDSDGCSIFAPHEMGGKLVLLTSTGVGLRSKFDGECVVREADNQAPVFYSLGNPDDELYGILSYLSEHPEVGVVRIISLHEFEQGNEGGFAAPIPRRVVRDHMEPLSSDDGDRRFLGIAIPVGSRLQIVVRVVRSTKKPPFTAEDAELFARVMHLCSTAELFGEARFDRDYRAHPGPALGSRPA